jgi:UrcA family protein
MIRTATFAKSLVLAAAAFAGAGFAATAQAADSDDQIPHAVLNVSSIDLTSDRAVAALKTEVRRTAAEICTPYGDGSGKMSRDEQTCFDVAVRNSFADIEARHQLALARLPHANVAANTDVRPAH